jgi:hypothetical protein
MGWFRLASDRLTYRGRLSQKPYAAWATTAEGASTIDARARQHRVWLFAKTVARRRIWRELDGAGRGDVFGRAIQSEADRFTALLVQTSHAPGLLRRSIALHRLVVVPRVLVAARTRTGARKRLYEDEALAALEPRVRDFFFEQLVIELDAAIAERRPSVSRPVLMHEGWRCVGRVTDYQWTDPMFCGPGWGGHLLMFEFPNEGLSRRARKELERSAQELQSSLKGITPAQRHDIMRMAVDALPRMTA